jgi:hypothetical protein
MLRPGNKYVAVIKWMRGDDAAARTILRSVKAVLLAGVYIKLHDTHAIEDISETVRACVIYERFGICGPDVVVCQDTTIV